MERIGKEIERGLARMGDGAGLVLQELTACWPAAVGEQIARNAWPLRVARDGTLHVATSSATWAFELDRMRSEIAEQLAAVAGESAPKELRFRPGPIPEPGAAPAEERAPKPPQASPETSREAASAASAIEDPELRELVVRAARASLARARSDRGFW
ncbi:MAG: DUF721 domain-containing protein [Actinobacteria bacterium]|nr:DUF721 domain-containing protein [Actinomycetota bacterium]